MNARSDDDREPIDRQTSRSICRAVAERLRDSLQAEPSRNSFRLQQLVEELRRRDETGGRSSK